MNGQQTYNRDTFIVQMTLGELLDAIDAHLAGTLQQVEQQAASEGEGYVYGIIGLGRFGTALAEELSAAGADMIILDRDEERIDYAKELTENTYIVKNLEKKTLLETGMHNCDIVVLCIGE